VAGLFVEVAEVLVLDAVLAAHLLDEQFAVAVDEDAMVGAEFQGMFQGADQGGVLGLVIGHAAEAAGLLDGFLAAAGEDVGEGGGAGVAARGAVGVNSDEGGVGHCESSAPARRAAPEKEDCRKAAGRASIMVVFKGGHETVCSPPGSSVR